MIASNACGPSYDGVGPITLSSPPNAIMTETIDTINCIGATYTFKDSSSLGYMVTNSGAGNFTVIQLMRETG